MERWTNEPEAHLNAMSQPSAEPGISVGLSCPADNAGENRPLHSAPSAFRPEESRAGSAVRVKRAVDRLQQQSGLQSHPEQRFDRQALQCEGQETALSRLVELEIIPRLMLLHGAPAVEVQSPQLGLAVVLGSVQVEALARLAAEGEPNGASSYVRSLLDAGASLEQVYLDLLGPAAKLLGSQWEDDVYDFSSVTIGLWRLQQVVHEQGSRLDASWTPPSSGQRALLSATPGSNHTFGLAILAEFFARAGWDVQHEVTTSWVNLKQMVGAQWFDMVGISVAKAADVLDLSAAIAALRQVSVNPQLLVMVGGPASTLVTDLAQVSGADLTACDAASAVELANRWMGNSVSAG